MALGDIAPSLYFKVKFVQHFPSTFFARRLPAQRIKAILPDPSGGVCPGNPWLRVAVLWQPRTHGPMDQGESFEWQGGQDPSATGEAELWLFGDYLEVGQTHFCCFFLVFPSLVPKCDCWVWSGVGASRMQGIRNRIDISWNPVVYGSEQSSLEFFPAV